MHRLACAILLIAAVAGAAPVDSSLAAAPEGWFLAGLDRQSYTIDRDEKVVREGKSSARFASKGKPTGFGTMMQSIAPDEYRGKRLRFSGQVKAKDVSNWAGLWMRVDGPEQKMLSFDNMGDRPIKGTKDWTKYDVVLDVPESAIGVSFGILMDGTGTLWLDGVRLEVVDTSVPVTGKGRGGTNAKPKNLDFEN